MTDRLTDEEIAEMRERRKEGVAIIESAIRNDDLDAAWDGKDVLSQLAWEEIPRLLDEVERLREQTQLDAGRIETLMEEVGRLQQERVELKGEVKRAVQRKCEMHNELADVKDTVRELHDNWTGVRIETLEQAVRFVVGERDIRIRDLLEKVERLRQRVAMHPNGRCGCHGEGGCQWCRMTDAVEQRDRYREALEEIRDRSDLDYDEEQSFMACDMKTIARQALEPDQ